MFSKNKNNKTNKNNEHTTIGTSATMINAGLSNLGKKIPEREIKIDLTELPAVSNEVGGKGGEQIRNLLNADNSVSRADKIKIINKVNELADRWPHQMNKAFEGLAGAHKDDKGQNLIMGLNNALSDLKDKREEESHQYGVIAPNEQLKGHKIEIEPKKETPEVKIIEPMGPPKGVTKSDNITGHDDDLYNLIKGDNTLSQQQKDNLMTKMNKLADKYNPEPNKNPNTVLNSKMGDLYNHIDQRNKKTYVTFNESSAYAQKLEGKALHDYVDASLGKIERDLAPKKQEQDQGHAEKKQPAWKRFLQDGPKGLFTKSTTNEPGHGGREY